jgi:hypothetical protein
MSERRIPYGGHLPPAQQPSLGWQTAQVLASDLAALTAENAELRRVLLALLAGLDKLEPNWLVDRAAGPQIAEARRVVAK